jgi:hypothetical protein
LGSFISSQAASAALSYSPRLKAALAASSRCRSAVRPVTSSASKVVVGAAPFFEAGGGGTCVSCFAGCAGVGAGGERSSPRSCAPELVAAGVVGAGVVGAGVLGGAFFFFGGGGGGWSSPWNCAAAVPEKRRARARVAERSIGYPSFKLPGKKKDSPMSKKS